MMKRTVEYRCEQHSDSYECPDNLVVYIEKFDEFGLIVHDGGHSFSVIQYCPWCGQKLPDSKRDRWFDELEAKGIDPAENDIPPEYQDRSWYTSSEAKGS